MADCMPSLRDFAPWAGLVLAQVAPRQGTVYDIRRFAPGRLGTARD